jgi:phosphatidylglycerol---prolipoprotein diacylglyceryl transferase
MDPVAFSLGPLEIRWYGIAMALSMLVGAWLASRLLSRTGRDGNVMWDALFYVILWGIVGARLVYVLTNLNSYAAEPWKVFYVWEGGLAFHGGIIAAGIVAWNIFQSRGIPGMIAFDAMIPGVCIGIILVRIGNFMNGDILGYKWDGPWAMNFPYDEYHIAEGRDAIIMRHPTELYGLLVGVISLIVASVLWRMTYIDKKLRIGTAWLSGFIAYSIARGVIEDPFRTVPLIGNLTPNAEAQGWGIFTTSQLISIPIILIMIWCLTQLPKWEVLQLKSVEGRKGGGEPVSRQVKRAQERAREDKSKDDKPKG